MIRVSKVRLPAGANAEYGWRSDPDKRLCSSIVLGLLKQATWSSQRTADTVARGVVSSDLLSPLFGSSARAGYFLYSPAIDGTSAPLTLEHWDAKKTEPAKWSWRIFVHFTRGRQGWVGAKRLLEHDQFEICALPAKCLTEVSGTPKHFSGAVAHDRLVFKLDWFRQDGREGLEVVANALLQGRSIRIRELLAPCPRLAAIEKLSKPEHLQHEDLIASYGPEYKENSLIINCSCGERVGRAHWVPHLVRHHIELVRPWATRKALGSWYELYQACDKNVRLREREQSAQASDVHAATQMRKTPVDLGRYAPKFCPHLVLKRSVGDDQEALYTCRLCRERIGSGNWQQHLVQAHTLVIKAEVARHRVVLQPSTRRIYDRSLEQLGDSPGPRFHGRNRKRVKLAPRPRRAISAKKRPAAPGRKQRAAVAVKKKKEVVYGDDEQRRATGGRRTAHGRRTTMDDVLVLGPSEIEIRPRPKPQEINIRPCPRSQ